VYKVDNKFIYWNFVRRENFFDYRRDLSVLKGRYTILGITSDWHGSLVSSIKHIFNEDIPHQRCLVHTERYCKQKLTLKPKTESGIELLQLTKQLNKIETKIQSKKWLRDLHKWYYKYGHLTTQRSQGFKEDGSKTWWYTHKNLRATYRTLYTTLDHLFLHLDYTGLSKDTNGLEVEFKHLNHKIDKHTSLTRRNKVSLMFWYLYLKNQKRS